MGEENVGTLKATFKIDYSQATEAFAFLRTETTALQQQMASVNRQASEIAGTATAGGQVATISQPSVVQGGPQIQDTPVARTPQASTQPLPTTISGLRSMTRSMPEELTQRVLQTTPRGVEELARERSGHGTRTNVDTLTQLVERLIAAQTRPPTADVPVSGGEGGAEITQLGAGAQMVTFPNAIFHVSITGLDANEELKTAILDSVQAVLTDQNSTIRRQIDDTVRPVRAGQVGHQGES